MESRTYYSNTGKTPQKNFRGNPGDRKKIKTDSSEFRNRQNFTHSESGSSERRWYDESSHMTGEHQSSFYRNSNNRGFPKGPSRNRGGGHQNYGSYSKNRQFCEPTVDHAKNFCNEQPDSNAGTNSSCEHSSDKNAEVKHSEFKFHPSCTQLKELSPPRNEIVGTYCGDVLDAPIKPPQLKCDIPELAKNRFCEQEKPSVATYTPKNRPRLHEIKTHNMHVKRSNYDGASASSKQFWEHKNPSTGIYAKTQYAPETFDMYIKRKDHDIGEGRFYRDIDAVPPRFKMSIDKYMQEMENVMKQRFLMLGSQMMGNLQASHVPVCTNTSSVALCKSDNNWQNAASEHRKPAFQQSKIAGEASVCSEVENQVYQHADGQSHDIMKTGSCGTVKTCNVTAVPGEAGSSPQSSENSHSVPMVKTQTDEGHKTDVLPYKKSFQHQKNSYQRNYRYNDAGHSQDMEREDAKRSAYKVGNARHTEQGNKPSRNAPEYNTKPPFSRRKFLSHSFDSRQYSTRHSGFSNSQLHSTSHSDSHLCSTSPRGGAGALPCRTCAEETHSEENVRTSPGRNLEHSSCKTPAPESRSGECSASASQDVGIREKNVQGITLNQQDDCRSKFKNASNVQKRCVSVEGIHSERYVGTSPKENSEHLDCTPITVQKDTHSANIKPDVGRQQNNMEYSTHDQRSYGCSELNRADSRSSTGWHRAEAVCETDASASECNVHSACTDMEMENQRLPVFSDDQLSVSSDHSTNNRKGKRNLLEVQVSNDTQKLDYWRSFLEKVLLPLQFEVTVDYHTNYMLNITFLDRNDARKAWGALKEVKGKSDDGRPFIKRVKFPRYNYNRNLANRNVKILGGCLRDIGKLYSRAVETQESKMAVSKKKLDIAQSIHDWDSVLTIQGRMKELEEMQSVFFRYTEAKKKEMKSEVEKPETNSFTVANNLLKMKKDFIREYNCYKAGLPIYAKKEDILDMIIQNQVSVLVAETGSGKSTQIAQYLLQSDFSKDGMIVCTQPRKIAAVTIAKYISGQIGSPVGTTVGYEVGLDKKIGRKTKIVYMTDYVLLKKCVRNRNLEGISCVVVDEAHERSLFTDLLLAIIKKCLPTRPDIRVIVTSATVDLTVFRDYFSLPAKAVLSVPGRMFPVEIKWQEANAYVGWNFLEGCVKLVREIHEEGGEGDILVFLTSPQETDEAVNLCKQILTKDNKNLPSLLSLHGKQDMDEQMKVFSPTPKGCRKIVFATNAAETSVTIPGIKFVIDSGMVKEKQYIAEKNRNALVVGFISKSSAEQRKGRAGRTQAGVCYRLYSKNNYDKDMPERIVPEILRINLQLALLRILEFKMQPEDFDFVESPSRESIASALHSLEFLGVVKNKCFTDLGKQITKLPLEPQLGKLVILGAEQNVGYEACVIASIATVSGMVFFRNEDNRQTADKKKIRFCEEGGDFLTFLNVFKEWYYIPQEQKPQWSAENCINAKAMRIAYSTAEELIQTLRCELRIKVYKHFKPSSVLYTKYEKILFECFSENICVFSGHQKIGYFSPFETGSFFVHPSSSLCYLDSKFHNFIIFSSVLKTSRTFLLNVTPISESTIISAFQKGAFPYQIDMLKHLQITPVRIYPVGESILIRHVLGRQGYKLHELEQQIKLYAKTDAFYIDVRLDKGEILVYIEQSHHAIVTKLINSVIQEAQCQMGKEEEIFRIAECASSCVAVSSGGIVNDILLPGEFREVIVEGYHKFPSVDRVISKLKDYGALQFYKEVDDHGNPQILATYVKACDAQRAVEHLQKSKLFGISSKVSYAKLSDKSLPLFRLQVTWPRFPCLGTGWISFPTFTDCIEASGILTNKSFYIADQYILFTPAKGSEKVLQMKNLPRYVEVQDITRALKDHLPEHLKVRNVELVREKWYKASEKELSSIKKQLFQMFGQYTPSSKLVINLRSPNASEILWTALVYFENFEDGEQALKCLTGKDVHKAKVGEHKLQIRPVLKSSLHCNMQVFELVKKNLHTLMSYSKMEGICTEFDVKPSLAKNSVLITFSCSDIKNLDKVRQEIRKLIRGTTLPRPGQDPAQFSRIFSKSGEEYLKSVEQNTKTVININSFRKTVTIFGLKEGVSSAESQISCYISSSSDEQVKVFNLCGKKIPSGFFKALRQKFGFQLIGLIQKYSLRAADIDFAKRTLTVKCSEKTMKLVEQCLADLCVKVNKSNTKNVSSDQETCPVCLDVITSDLFRLNHCGHAFCTQCLLLQIESKVIPLLCSKQDCEKPLFIEDICKLIVGNEELKKEFGQASLKNFIARNNSVRCCPVPDCSMVYRVASTGSSSTEFHCPSCENDICTRCHAFYHHGMTCEMFQKSRVDEHYPLKVWMEEDTENRKQCPNCSSGIEKVDGCNHVHCTLCDTHLCWLCLRTFSTGATDSVRLLTSFSAASYQAQMLFHFNCLVKIYKHYYYAYFCQQMPSKQNY